jgi:hypothetical protein
MQDEHAAWLVVGDQFKQMDIDINEAKWTPLIRAIEFWGEELARLRSTQEEKVIRHAWEEKETARRLALEGRSLGY